MRQTILEPAKFRLLAKVNSASSVDSNITPNVTSSEVFPPLTAQCTVANQPGMAEVSESTNGLNILLWWTDSTKNPVDSWASLAGKNVDSLFHRTAAEYVLQVRPIILAYKYISWEAHHLPIAEIALSIAWAVNNADQIDGIQPMKSGWNIYIKTEVDRAQLLISGLNVASQYVALTVSRSNQTESVKLIIKDLPLHEVSNQDVLAALKENFEVLSEVKYSNVFINGKCIHL